MVRAPRQQDVAAVDLDGVGDAEAFREDPRGGGRGQAGAEQDIRTGLADEAASGGDRVEQEAENARAGGAVCSVIPLLLEPRFRQNREVVFHYCMRGENAASFTNWLHQGRFRHELPVLPRVESGFVQVEMAVEVPEDWDNHFRLVQIGYQLR